MNESHNASEPAPTPDLISAVEAVGMPLTHAHWVERGFPAELWRTTRRFALANACPLSGRCHGEKQHCIHCGPVDKTCSDEGCAIHMGAARCGRRMPTSLGYRICAEDPGHLGGCFAIQSDWYAHRKALRHDQ